MVSKVNAEKLVNHLNEKWKGRTCPMCGGGPWNASDMAFELREFNEGNLVVGGVPITPVIPVTCSNCGNTILINAVVAGLVTKSKEGSQL
jgi:ribosomal protein S27AE